MKRILFNALIYFVFSTTCAWAQADTNNIVVGSVGDEEVTYSELKQNMSSTTPEQAPSLSELEDFLPVYLNYRAKLKAAKDEGYYEDSVLVEEHKSYTKQAAYSKWLQQEIKPTIFETYYKRANLELKTFHILIAATSQTPKEDIEDIKSKLKEAKEEIKSGTPLDQINEKYSTVRNGRSMGGDLPWISAGRTVREFEDVAYNLEVGEISEPFKTQFGYHIVLLQDKREKTPARLTNHIFVRGTQNEDAYNKINEAYNLLENGEKWATVLRNYTEDRNSIPRNGRIGWVNYQSNFAPDFVDAIISLDATEDYSKPVQTNYGYHIFKIDSVETYSSEQAKREALKEEFSDSPYFKENNSFVVEYLKKEYNHETFENSLDAYTNFLKTKDTLRVSKIQLSPTNLAKRKVYSFNDTAYHLSDLHSYITRHYANRKAGNYDQSWFNQFTEYVVDSQIISLTHETFPEFKQQSKSYKDGLAVYQINEDNVWSSATVDTARLLNIYEANLENYTYSKRPYYFLITAPHDSVLSGAKSFINSGHHPDSLRGYFPQVRVSSDSTNNYSEPPFDHLEGLEKGDFSDTFEYNNRRAMFWLKDRLPARRMTFDEAFDKLVSEFQPVREQEWIEKLRENYSVEAYFDKLQKAYQQDS